MELKKNCILRYHPIIEYIENQLLSNKTTIIVAIDGRCASGKTTFGEYLKSVYDCNLFHMDDFFLQPYQRTADRLQEPGGNVDYERFYSQVIVPVMNHETVKYQRFDCQKMQLEDSVIDMFPKRLNIIEGSYSHHPYFQEPYDVKVFFNIDKKLQVETIEKRNGIEKLEIFKSKWIPMEESYFEKYAIKSKSNIVIQQTFSKNSL